tara:strand:- start:472 stop:573 length:102 start_codon:yes stop_codon:yes gene_type:complete
MKSMLEEGRMSATIAHSNIDIKKSLKQGKKGRN